MVTKTLIADAFFMLLSAKTPLVSQQTPLSLYTSHLSDSSFEQICDHTPALEPATAND